MPAETIASILLRNPRLRQLCVQIQQLNQVQACLERILPDDLGPHYRATAILGDSLILHAESPAWATRLRYLIPDMLAALSGMPDLRDIRSIRIRTVPHSPPATGEKPHRTLSADTAKLLRDVAGSIQDPKLRATLLRLSRH